MKKFQKLLVLSFSALLSVGVIAGCTLPSTSSPAESTPAESSPVETTPTETSTPEVQTNNIALDTKEFLEESYKGTSSVMADFTLPTVHNTYDGDNPTTVNIAWELSVNAGGVEGAIVKGEAEGNKQAFTVKYSPADSSVATTFTITGTITDVNGNVETITFNWSVPKFEFATYDDFVQAVADKSTDVLNVKGHVIAVYKDGLYFEDENGDGFYAYRPTGYDATAYSVGDEILVSGTATSYSSQYEFSSGCTLQLLAEASADFAPVYEDVTDAFLAATGKSDAAVFDKHQNSLVEVKGVTVDTYSAEKDSQLYYYFTIGNVTTYLRPYSGWYNQATGAPYTQAEINELVSEWNKGYTANLKGVLSIYGGAYYLSLVSNDAITYTSKELPEAEKAANAAEQNAGSFKDVYVMPHTFDLPSSTESNGASYTYEVVEGTAASINSDGDLVVAPLATDSKVKVKITATIGGASGEYTKEFTVKGSAYETITAAQALDIINGLENGAYADDWYYVSATVGEIYNTGYCNFYLPVGDNAQAIVVYGLWSGEDSGTNRYGENREIKEIPVKEGDEVVLYTRLQKYAKSDGTITPELVNAMLIGPAAPSYDVYTSADENITLGDYTLAYDANGKVIFASCTADGYGGPADGFYHDGSYSWVAGQQCGIFLLDERFAGWPAKLEDGTACWTLYTVKAPEGVTILTGSAEAMLDVFNQAFSANLTELNGNGYFENELTDGQFNDVVVNFGSSDTEESTPVAPFQHTFDLGENAAEEKHVDGTALAETFELTSGENTLTVTNATKVYGPAFDAKGNSVIKFGTGSATGSITLTVGEDVDYVIFYVAQYKSNTTVVDVNGTTYTIETASNNGEYTEVRVDTTTNKTVVFSTTDAGKRCMINTIVLGGGDEE